MFLKLVKKKVFRDPIYGYIDIDYKIIIDLIDTLEFQRLRRIKQLSGAAFVFQTAEHSRFTHSLGTYQMANIFLKEIEGLVLDEYETILFLTSALLHDIGHGPYSHAFEGICSLNHEEFGALIITSKSSSINRVLNSYHKDLAKDISDVLLKRSKYKLIESLISGDIDVDRLDYLLRDTYYTGATYGTVDRGRLLRSLVIKDNRLVVKNSGVPAIESYFVARYAMYIQVYYHYTALSHDLLLVQIYKRLVELRSSLEKDYKEFFNVVSNNSILDYLYLDDHYVINMIKRLATYKDSILSTLCSNLLTRNFYKIKTCPLDFVSRNDYFDFTYTIHPDRFLKLTNINLKVSVDDDLLPITEVSEILKALVKCDFETKNLHFFYE